MSGKKARGRTLAAADLRQIVEAIPAPLAARLDGEFAGGLQTAVNEALERAIVDEQGTVEQLVERVDRRWPHGS